MKIEMAALLVPEQLIQQEWTFFVLRVSAIFFELKEARGIYILINRAKTVRPFHKVRTSRFAFPDTHDYFYHLIRDKGISRLLFFP